MTKLMIQEDKYLRKQARTHWYRDDDLNTKKIHAYVTSRKKVNQILSLERVVSTLFMSVVHGLIIINFPLLLNPQIFLGYLKTKNYEGMETYNVV